MSLFKNINQLLAILIQIKEIELQKLKQNKTEYDDYPVLSEAEYAHIKKMYECS